MPRTKSAKKALRQSSRRRLKNLDQKNRIKEMIKNLRRAAAEGKNEKTRPTLSQVYKALDKAAKTGYIKKNKASRLKSRLTKKLRNR